MSRRIIRNLQKSSKLLTSFMNFHLNDSQAELKSQQSLKLEKKNLRQILAKFSKKFVFLRLNEHFSDFQSSKCLFSFTIHFNHLKLFVQEVNFDLLDEIEFGRSPWKFRFHLDFWEMLSEFSLHGLIFDSYCDGKFSFRLRERFKSNIPLLWL
jgi:hypothetical protein